MGWSRQQWLRWALLLLLGITCASQRLPAESLASQATPVATPVMANGWWRTATCYEVFVRSFFDSDGDGIGDLNGLTAKLDYLNDGNPATTSDLGVTCVWLMPIAEATSYHGYDTIDYFMVERDYGTNDDFTRFVAAAHARGICVITDLVLNHVSVEHPWFQEALANPDSPYRDYFVFSPGDPGYSGSFGQKVWYPTPAGDAYYYATFGEGLPDLNYRNPAVTAEAEEIARFWLLEMDVDGFRLDAIKHLIERERIQENTPESHEWLRAFAAYLEAVKPGSYTIGEIFGASAATLQEYYPDQLTAYFQFEIGAQIVTAASSGIARGLVDSVSRTVSGIPDQRWGSFLSNHDQTRSIVAFNHDLEKAKLAATALLTLPGLPYIYYGEEIGMTGLKPDERLRTPMQWTADASGFTSGTPWEPFQDDLAAVNVAEQETDPDSLLNHYRALVQLRAAHPALTSGECYLLDSPPTVAAFIRQSGDETLLVALNFGAKPAAIPELSVSASGVAPGEYAVEAIFGSLEAGAITVNEDGAIAGYTGLPGLAPRTGYVLRLT